MKINRIIVEDGFLDGLDLTFSDGLNVIIGARGTGKTSVIELIRFCLDVQNFTETSKRRSREHAEAVIGQGQVTVELNAGETPVRVVRAWDDREPRVTANVRNPIMFSQTDIETIGLEPIGRLRLLDSFAQIREEAASERQITAEIKSLTVELRSLSRECESLSSQLSSLPEVQQQLTDATDQEKKLAANSRVVANKQKQLKELSAQTAAFSVAGTVLHRAVDQIGAYSNRISALVSSPPILEPWPAEAGKTDMLLDARARIAATNEEVRRATAAVNELLEAVRRKETDVNKGRAPVEQSARAIRQEIEKLQEGAGAVSRAAGALRERLAQLQSLTKLRDERLRRLAELQEQRGTALDRLDAVREQRFAARSNAAKRLTTKLRPRIQVSVLRTAQFGSYSYVLAQALKGSGLKYHELSSQITERISPRELIELVESADAQTLATTAQIGRERASRVIAALQDAATEDLLTTTIEDDVRLELLDGTDYKPIENLSTGQRCTVVLPIVMEHKDRVVIVDQPEDHLDNAFIVDTLIKAIINRGTKSQLILTTHNANVPVLGNAQQVTLLGSDGQRGFVLHSGDLEDHETVDAITTVMEGGREAFNRRAEFYTAHASS